MSTTQQFAVFTPKKRKLSELTVAKKCCLCPSTSRNRRDVTFHNFPQRGKCMVQVYVTDAVTGARMKKDRLTAWLDFANLQESAVYTKKICSLHFVREDFFYGGAASWKARKALKSTAVPSILHPMYQEEVQPPIRIWTSQGSGADIEAATETLAEELIDIVEVQGEPVAPTVVDCVPPESLSAILPLRRNSSETRTIGTQTEWNTKSVETQTFTLVANAETEVHSGDFKTSFTSFLDSDQKLNAFTGIATLKLFMTIVALYEMLKPNSNRCHLKASEKIILTMIKLRLNLPFRVLSVFFDISPTTVKNVFHEAIFVIHACIQNMLYWPTKEEVMSCLPLSFIQNGFANTRVILDGTEIKTTKTKCIKCRCRVFSFYKGCHTIKFMIGITPGGLIVFVSKPFGGRASDKFIFIHSGLIRLLYPFVDAIMVDKGFLIQDICDEHNVQLIMPHFLRKKKRFSKAEAQKNRKVAACRVHVERAIGRMKDFRILKDTLPWNLSGYAEVITRVIACVVNMSAPLISEHRFANPSQQQLESLNNVSYSFESSLDLDYDEGYEDVEVVEISFQ